jgi:hypothetical protein
MKYSSVGLGLMLLFAASSCLAQSQDQSQDKNNGTAATNAAKPDAAANSTPANPPAEKKKQKKVWTNDEIGSVGGTVSVVGESTASSSTGSASSGLNKKKTEPDANAPADDARQRLIDNYRNQIADIHSQMDAIDERIAQLKSFKAENTDPTGGINPTQGYNMVPLEDQVKQLEEKKKKLDSKISDIEVEAEKNGIDPGDLR